MSVQVEKLDGNMAKLTITVDADVFEKAIESAYQKNRGKINVQGFRKGKAPRKMIEKMYGPEVFYEDAANICIPDAYEKAFDECEEEIVSQPAIEVVSMGSGDPFVFTATVALRPEVTLGEYKGVKIDAIDVTVTDADVDAALKSEQEKQARKVEVTDRAVKAGDDTIIDFEGFVDGVAFQGGKGEDYPLTIGSGAFIPGFEDALIGAEIGKETDVNVTFPEDYQAEELAGKAAVFKCTVKSISVKELPELNDEFASEVSEFDNLKDYKESIKADLEAKKLSDAKAAKQDAVVDKIVENAKMDIPDAMLETEQKNMINDFAQRIQSQGLTFQQYMQFSGLTMDKFMEQVKPQALSRIQSRLVLEEVAKAENLTVTDEDYEAELKTMAEAYALELDKVKGMVGEDGEKQIRKDILVKKALEFVADNAKETKKRAPRKKAADKEEAAKTEESAE
ncbi:MAG: trigger factor [Lachnospiraceae bacterium]|nr:trigger factor [Lachnospiraceae bacterium]